MFILAVTGAVLYEHSSSPSRPFARASLAAFNDWNSYRPPTTTPVIPSLPKAPQVTWPAAPRRTSRGCGRTLDQIGADESHNDYGAVNPSSGAGGRFQILPSTWRANGGTGLPQNASPAEQDRIAQKIYTEQGTRPWRASGC